MSTPSVVATQQNGFEQRTTKLHQDSHDPIQEWRTAKRLSHSNVHVALSHSGNDGVVVRIASRTVEEDERGLGRVGRGGVNPRSIDPNAVLIHYMIINR